MNIYSSIAQMYDSLAENGWKKSKISKGFILNPLPEIATGSISVLGDPRIACFIDSDVVFHIPIMEMCCSEERGIQITFVEDMNVEYYKSENEIENARFGIFCYVNNTPIPWFKHFPAGTVQRGCSIIVTESFFHEANIMMPEDGWNRAARSINQREFSLPALATICRQIKQSQIQDECFPIFFRAKIIEAVSLLLDHAFQIEKNKMPSISKKSRLAVQEALHILDDCYISPPIIKDLALTVGVNKKTLQFAFDQIVGQSIHKYIRMLKMQKSIILLEDRTMRIEDVARAVGYQSKIHFYKAFKSTYGCTPFEMRKM